MDFSLNLDVAFTGALGIASTLFVYLQLRQAQEELRDKRISDRVDAVFGQRITTIVDLSEKAKVLLDEAHSTGEASRTVRAELLSALKDAERVLGEIRQAAEQAKIDSQQIDAERYRAQVAGLLLEVERRLSRLFPNRRSANPIILLGDAVDWGVISPEDAETLKKIANVRDEAVHDLPLDPAESSLLLPEAQKVLSRLDSAVGYVEEETKLEDQVIKIMRSLGAKIDHYLSTSTRQPTGVNLNGFRFVFEAIAAPSEWRVKQTRDRLHKLISTDATREALIVTVNSDLFHSIPQNVAVVSIDNLKDYVQSRL